MVKDCPDKPPMICTNCGEEGTARWIKSYEIGEYVTNYLRPFQKELREYPQGQS